MRGTTTLATHAVETGAPLFLLVHYRHDAEKREWVEALAQRLSEAGIEIRRFDLWREPELGTGRLYQELGRLGERQVGVVTSLPRAERPWEVDAEFLAYVNLHRDEIARSKLRWVLAVHESEEEALLAQAGDLWDFRQQDFWLERPPEAISFPGQYRLPLSSRFARDESDFMVRLAHVGRGTAAGLDDEQSVRRQLEETTDEKLKARLLVGLAEHLLRMDGVWRASKVGLEALSHVSGGADPALEARIQARIGEAMLKAGDPRQALFHLDQARTLGERLVRFPEALKVIYNRYSAYLDLGNYEAALGVFEEALSDDRSNRPSGCLSARQRQLLRNRYAALLFALGRLEEAQRLLEDQIMAYQASGSADSLVAELYYNLGIVQFSRGDWDKAASSFQWCINGTDSIFQGYALAALGQVREAQEDLVTALREFQAALEFFQNGGHLPQVIAVLSDLEKLYAAWGWSEAAAALSSTAAEVAEHRKPEIEF